MKCNMKQAASENKYQCHKTHKMQFKYLCFQMFHKHFWYLLYSIYNEKQTTKLIEWYLLKSPELLNIILLKQEPCVYTRIHNVFHF